jgi:hypothetical protein
MAGLFTRAMTMSNKVKTAAKEADDFAHDATEADIKEALRHLIAIGAVVDSGFRSEDGEVRWTLDRTHPYWAQIWEEIEGECPPEIKRN